MCCVVSLSPRCHHLHTLSLCSASTVAYARDFCFLQHATYEIDPETGERLFVVVAGSIERPEVPDMEKLCKRIRSTVETSGTVLSVGGTC